MRIERCIYQRGPKYDVRVCIDGHKARRVFEWDAMGGETAALAAARRFRDTRSASRARAETVDQPNMDESVSTVGGKMYLYVRLRKHGQVIKSRSVGRLHNSSSQTRAALRRSDKYKAVVRDLCRVLKESADV